MPSSSIIIDEQIPFFAASGLSAAVATVSMSSLGNMPTLPEEMPPMLADWTLAHDVAPVAPQTTGESPQESTDQPIAPPRIPSAGPNGVVITTLHPRLAHYPPRIYRERRIGSGSSGHRALYLASPLAEASGSYQTPITDHVRALGLQENRPPAGSSGRTPYYFTPSNPGERPLAETNNVGRYTNRQRRTGPQLRFQFELREPQQPPRPLRRPEPVVEILEENSRRDEVPRHLEANEDEGMDLFYLNSAALF